MNAPQTNEQVNCFVGRCKCGGIVFMSVDEPRYRKDNAKSVAGCIRRGFKIETLPIETTRTEPWCFKSKEHMSALKETP